MGITYIAPTIQTSATEADPSLPDDWQAVLSQGVHERKDTPIDSIIKYLESENLVYSIEDRVAQDETGEEALRSQSLEVNVSSLDSAEIVEVTYALIELYTGISPDRLCYQGQ